MGYDERFFSLHKSPIPHLTSPLKGRKNAVASSSYFTSFTSSLTHRLTHSRRVCLLIRVIA
jgi:hypothetical protein